MPVVSPSRYTSTSSTLSGSYRTTLGANTSLDKPYFRSTSGTYATTTLRNTIGDRTTEYRSRYSDVDGKRERKTSVVEYSRNSRAPSGDSDSGISTRYRSDRSESRSRDISTTRSESSKTTDRNARKSALNSAALAMSTAELYNKYSPANYIPLTQRIQQAQAQSNYGEIARSKSISNDIGRPPAPDGTRLRKPRNSTAATIIERPERRYKDTSPSPSYSKRNSLTNGIKDSNGNDVPSVSEIRKRFDQKMAVTKLPANENRYARSSVEHYLSQLKDCENGTDGYTKLRQDDKPVPIHLPYDKNGQNHKWEIGSSSSRSNSNSDLSSKTVSDPVTLPKPVDKSNNITVSYTAKLPSERLASIKSQLDPNNPIGKILEKSTVIHVENGDAKRFSPDKIKEKQSEIEKQVKPSKHTSNFASYIQISQPIATGTSRSNSREKEVDIKTSRSNSREVEINNVANDELSKEDKPEPRKYKVSLKYNDAEDEQDAKKVVDDENDVEVQSPPGTGFENKTFEHENFLKKRSECREIEKENEDGVKSMETSTESACSEDSSSSPDIVSRRKILDADLEDIKAPRAMRCGCRRCWEPRPAVAPPPRPHAAHPPSSRSRLPSGPHVHATVYGVNTYQELAGGKSGPSGLRRNSLRSDESRPDTERKPSHTSGLNGLRNIGNTCFMNSVLQCLSNTKPLLEYLTEDKYLTEMNTTLSCMKGALIKAFASLIKELWRSGEKDSVVNTTSFKSQVQRFAPRFMGYSQQDAQEFLRYLLEGLHEDVNRVTVKPKPILTEIDDTLSDSAKAAEAWSRYLRMEDSRVGDIFVGQLKSTLRCTHCNHDSVTFDPFWDLSLSLPSRTGNLKLQQCLQHFTKEEEMDGDEKPTCSKCGVRRKCLKWFTVQKFPQVLVIHLKRFSPTERFRGKLNVVVEFPLNGLDMSPYAACKGVPSTYNLYAVSNHSGTTYSGHYTAYCKHPYTGEWHEYNDSRVSPINPRNVVSSEAYVLFYELARSTQS